MLKFFRIIICLNKRSISNIWLYLQYKTLKQHWLIKTNLFEKNINPKSLDHTSVLTNSFSTRIFLINSPFIGVIGFLLHNIQDPFAGICAIFWIPINSDGLLKWSHIIFPMNIDSCTTLLCDLAYSAALTTNYSTHHITLDQQTQWKVRLTIRARHPSVLIAIPIATSLLFVQLLSMKLIALELDTIQSGGRPARSHEENKTMHSSVCIPMPIDQHFWSRLRGKVPNDGTSTVLKTKSPHYPIDSGFTGTMYNILRIHFDTDHYALYKLMHVPQNLNLCIYMLRPLYHDLYGRKSFFFLINHLLFGEKHLFPSQKTPSLLKKKIEEAFLHRQSFNLHISLVQKALLPSFSIIQI